MLRQPCAAPAGGGASPLLSTWQGRRPDEASWRRRGGVVAAARQTSGQSDAKASPVSNAPTACVGFTGNFV